MRAGALDTRVRIERAQQHKSASGEAVTDSWAKVVDVSAGVRTLKAAERWAGVQLVAEADSAFEMRAFPGPPSLGPEDRYRLRKLNPATQEPMGPPHNIVGIVPGRRGQGVLILTRARAETTAAL